MDGQLPVAGTDITNPQVAAMPESGESVPSRMPSIALPHKPSAGRRVSATSGLRRLRQGRACVTCHARKVRCDAASLGIPCTNCAAFSLECRVPTKNGSPSARRDKDNLRLLGGGSVPGVPLLGGKFSRPLADGQTLLMYGPSQGMHFTPLAEPKLEQQAEDTKYYAKLIKKEATETPIKEAGRVVYLEESTNMSLLINDYKSPAGMVHYPMYGNAELGYSGSTKMDKVELDILDRRGALTLPPRAVSDDLIKTYFKWVAPVMPIINKTRFMQQYRDPNNPPSLLLLQAVFLAGSRACTNAQLMDSNGSTIPAATTFYNRAKALYEASYEEDRIAIVQALILMGWYWEEPGKFTKNVFYWNGLAVTIAQGFGMHRNTEESRLSVADKRLWKRIWWTLFTRDRSVAVALGRPAHINMDDSDVEMIIEDDFIDDDGAQTAILTPGWLQVQFFLQYVKLCKVMDLVLLQNYSIASKARRHNALALMQCDMALAEWLQSCPLELRWEPSRHHFWSAFLFSTYHTTSCLLHRTYLSAAPSKHDVRQQTQFDRPMPPLRNPAFQAAQTITSIMETLSDHSELRFSPPFLIYSLSSALLIHVYQLHVALPATDVATQCRIRVCIACLEQISKVWLVAKMIQNLYEYILSEKGLGDFLKDSPGEIHDKSRPLLGKKAHSLAQSKNDGTTMGSSENSSERLRPQSLALTPALLAHLFAALNSGTSSSSLENGDSLKGGPESSNTTYHQQPAQITSLTHEEFHHPHLYSRNDPHISHQFTMTPKNEQLFTAQEPVSLNMSQFMPQHFAMDNSNTYANSQTMAMGNLPTQDMQLPQNRGYVQNFEDGSQYPPSQAGELQYSWPADGIGYYTTGSDYTSIDTTIAHPPAPTGPNVLAWIQYFGIANYE